MIFKASILRLVQDEIFSVAPNLGKNPRLLFSILWDTMDEVAPNYIQPIILQGIAGTYSPSVQASVPALVAPECLMEANSIINTVNSFSSLLGLVLEGFCTAFKV